MTLINFQGILSKEEEAAGIELRRLLYAGEEISDQLVFNIIRDKMSSPEVAHYGERYVAIRIRRVHCLVYNLDYLDYFREGHECVGLVSIVTPLSWNICHSRFRHKDKLWRP